MTDHETRSAVDALARWLADNEPHRDPDVLALDVITWLRSRGWRPTEARVRPAWKPPAGQHGTDPTAGYLTARQALDERLACREPGGDAA